MGVFAVKKKLTLREIGRNLNFSLNTIGKNTRELAAVIESGVLADTKKQRTFTTYEGVQKQVIEFEMHLANLQINFNEFKAALNDKSRWK